ncbi:MAG: biopolymer transporter ExbD [Pedosphaera sp.]|nr:biopolymer transporter ExbD [Pedosphaera sp.]
MKFPRNAKIFRGQLDVVPFAGVFFLLVLFLLLATLVYTPGVQIHLPGVANELPGVEGPTIAVALDARGQLYFENQIIQETNLLGRLREAVNKSPQPLTLVMQADQSANYGMCVHLAEVARAAGIKNASWQTLPRVFNSSNSSAHP